ncbi:hypothetical protein BTUL_0134g00080 [Botrytis tulipae]|uniref:Uncharacterized protein n=1 Tax=Botrytis tulipae TaxID=87230 RepID=A0A4Z1EN85_9HELO|nr:hypothetical protein BTUL_0134g00080 [Botrytis tulipae]
MQLSRTLRLPVQRSYNAPANSAGQSLESNHQNNLAKQNIKLQDLGYGYNRANIYVTNEKRTDLLVANS